MSGLYKSVEIIVTLDREALDDGRILWYAVVISGDKLRHIKTSKRAECRESALRNGQAIAEWMLQKINR